MRFLAIFGAVFLFFGAVLAAFGAESSADSSDFMSVKEYGKSLYNDPFGISCAKCHGEDGGGKKLATYTHKNKKKELIAPPINKLKLSDFRRALTNRPSGSFMPIYHFSDEEIAAIFEFITKP